MVEVLIPVTGACKPWTSSTNAGPGGAGFSVGFGASSSYNYRPLALEVKTKGSCGSELKDPPAKTSGSSGTTKKTSR